MQITVLGAGALGSLIGGRLAQAGLRTCLLSRNKDHISAIQEKGLYIEEMNGSVNHIQTLALEKPQELPEPPDIVLILVKAYDTYNAVSDIYEYCQSSTSFLTLQNGIGNLEQIAQLIPQDRILAGTTAQGATFLEPGRIRHGGNGPTHIGEIQGQPKERTYSLAKIFRQAGLKTEVTSRTREFIWHKLLINVGINAITALAGIPNGWISKYEPARELAREAVKEALDVAHSCGLELKRDVLDQVISVAQATAQNISSMNQDLQKGKKTEVEAINGAIVRLGQENSMATPVNRTLYRLVQIVQEKHLQGGNL